jgi:hypothetical protein
MRISVVGRKNFYGSGSRWSRELAATMYSLLMTVKLDQCRKNRRARQEVPHP